MAVGDDFTGSKWELVGDRSAVTVVTVVEGDLYTADATHVLVSHDAGSTWQAVGPDMPMNVSPIGLAVRGSRLVLGNYGVGILRSSTSDTVWSPANQGLSPQPDVLALRRVEDTILVGTQEGAFASTDDGLTWVPANDGIPDVMAGTRISVTRLSAAGTTVFAANNRGDSFRGTSAGESWAWSVQRVRYPWSVAVEGGYVFSSCLGFALPPGGAPLSPGVAHVIRSSDDGMTWMPAEVGLPQGVFHSFDMAVVGHMVFVAIQGSTAGMVFGTGDHGATWQPFADGFPQDPDTTMMEISSMVAVRSSVVAFVRGQGTYRLSARQHVVGGAGGHGTR